MNRRQCGLLSLIAFFGGLIGGLVSAKFLSDEVALAQSEKRPLQHRQIYAKTIIAEEFFLHEKKTSDPLDSEIPVARALLTTEPEGDPKLVMQDKNGNPRFSVSLSDNNGVSLAILNMKGESKALLSEKSSYGEKQLGCTLALLDDNGEIRAQIGVQADNNPFVSLNDPQIKDKKTGRSIRLCLKEKNEASISLHGIEGNQRAELRTDSKNTLLSFNGPDGKTRTEFGNTELSFGKDGTLTKALPGAQSVEKRPLSSIVLYNENEKVLWSAP